MNKARKGKSESLAQAATSLFEKMSSAQLFLAPTGTYTSNKTNCKPGCEICGGLGIVRYDVPEYHPNFGKLQPCPNLPAELRGTRWHSGLTQNEQDNLDWSVFTPTQVSITAWYSTKDEKVIKTTADKVAQHIRSYLDDGGWVWIWSPGWGVGKSLMLKAFIADGLRRGIQGVYLQMSEFLTDLRNAYNETDPREASINRLDRWMETPRLALDEYDKTFLTGWGEEQAFALLNRRYESGIDGMVSTFIASNAPPAGALASRASDGRMLLIKVDGRDVRPAMGKAMHEFLEGL